MLDTKRASWPWSIAKIISGGQTGADRAGLDWAIDHGIAHGGWCPRGRISTDGSIASRYNLLETESTGYRQRTRRNIESSDATVIFMMGPLIGGSLLTYTLAEKLAKPVKVYQLAADNKSQFYEVLDWLTQEAPEVINVAGPSESRCPGTYQATYEALDRIFQCDVTLRLS